MSQYLNGNAKGLFFPNAGSTFQQTFVGDPNFQIPAGGLGWTWPSGGGPGQSSVSDALNRMLQYWQPVLYGVLEMGSDNMLPLFDKTNNRIYGEL
jgi:hypothetical protein